MILEGMLWINAVRKSTVVGTAHLYSSRIRRAFLKHWHFYKILDIVDLCRKKKIKVGEEDGRKQGKVFYTYTAGFKP